MRMKGKTAVVIGASSNGVGKVVAETLAGEGANVVVAARRLAPLEELAKRIGGRAIACDVAEEKQVAAVAALALESFGKIDLAVNAVGMPLGGTIAEESEESLVNELRVNFLGSVWFIRHMSRVMNDHGSIILFSSMAASHPMPPFFGYGCAKAAADCLVKYAAEELGGRGIRVNSILPGLIRTDMASGIFSVPGMEEVFQREVALGRVGEAEDFADAVLWLAGRAYITGANLPISGGNQMTRFPRVDEYVEGVGAEVGHSSERHLG